MFLFSPLLYIQAAYGAGSENYVSESLDRFSKNMIDVYKDIGGYKLSTSVNNGFAYIEFCPDNTCDEFKFPVNSSISEVSDFVYLFEFSIPSYELLEKKWKSKPDVVDYVSHLTKRYLSSAKCHRKLDDKMLHICILRYLVKSQKIVISIVRYDEGERVASPTTLDEFFPK